MKVIRNLCHRKVLSIMGFSFKIDIWGINTDRMCQVSDQFTSSRLKALCSTHGATSGLSLPIKRAPCLWWATCNAWLLQSFGWEQKRFFPSEQCDLSLCSRETWYCYLFFHSNSFSNARVSLPSCLPNGDERNKDGFCSLNKEYWLFNKPVKSWH